MYTGSFAMCAMHGIYVYIHTGNCIHLNRPVRSRY